MKLDTGEINRPPVSVSRNDDSRVDNNGDTNHIEDSTILTSTEVERGGKYGNETMNRSYRVYRLTWEDIDKQKQQTCPQHEVILQMYMNTLTNTAMFKLHTKAVLRRSRRQRNHMESVYLHIPSEIIESISCQTTPDERKGSTASANHYALHFSLTKRPDLIAPQDIPLTSKGDAKDHLKLILDLATLTQLTVHLVSPGITTRDESSFKLLAATFSSQDNGNRPCKYSGLGDITSLYAGKGGKVISIINTCSADVNSHPPPYISEHFSNKHSLLRWN